MAVAESLSAPIEALLRSDRTADALPLAHRRVDLLSRWSGLDDSLLGAAWSRLADIQFQLGEAGRACDSDSLALRHRLRRFGRHHLEVAASLSKLGRDHKALGAGRSTGLALQQEALQLRLDLLGPNHPDVATTLSDLANLQRLLGRHEAAARLFGRALRIRRAAFGPQSEEVASTLTAMAFTYSRRELWPEAERLFREAVRIRRRAEIKRRENLAGSLGGWGMAQRHLGRPAEAILTLREALELQIAVRGDVPPGIGRASFNLATSLDLAAAQLETGDSLGAWQTCNVGAGRILLEDLASRRNLDVDSLAAATLSRVQELLPPRTAMIGWIDFHAWMRGGFPYWAWVLKADGKPAWIRFDAPKSGGLVYAWAGLDTTVAQLRAAGSWPLRVEETTQIDFLLRRLHGESFRPLVPHLRDVDRIIVVSGDVHHGVPLEALIDSDGGRLGDRYLISYVPSASIFAWIHGAPRAPRPPRAWRALLLSDPGGAPGRAAGNLAPLQMAREETAVLASLLPGARRSGLDSPDAVQRLRAGEGLADYDLIHIATHARIDDARAELSALYLTPADSGRAVAITAGDIAAAWRLRAELVTLSGCATVLGRGAGIEGVLGLNQVLLAAGARTLLASLWQVDDRATALLVGRFYENLIGTSGRPGLGLMAALQEARRHVRESRDPAGHFPYRHPAYWAGFVLMGDPD